MSDNLQVLITRAETQSAEFSRLLKQQGMTVWDMPTIEITPPSSYDPLDQAIGNLQDYDWLVFTSANGVNFFLDRLATLGFNLDVLTTCKKAVVGRKTAKALEQHGLSVDFIPPDFLSSELARAFPTATAPHETRLLYACLETGCRDEWVSELETFGYFVQKAATYDSRCPQEMPMEVLKKLTSAEINVATFSSPKTVVHFHQMLMGAIAEKKTAEIIESLSIAAIGPVTAAACLQELGKVDIQPQEYTIEGMVAAIQRYPMSKCLRSCPTL
jgi:uroporphyrinogen-III synthase